MSFGFSVGDFVAGAQLALRLAQSLSETKGSAQDHRELMAELNVVHKVLLQVDQLRSANQLAQGTTNELLFIVASTTDSMESFLRAHESYGASLRKGGTGNFLKDAWKKGSWALQMSNRVSKLRQTIAVMLASINCLVTLACYFNSGYNPKYEIRFTVVGDPLHSRSLQKDVTFGNIRIANIMNPREAPLCWSNSRTFKKRNDREDFFRPGQVFMLQVHSGFQFTSKSERTIGIDEFPLEDATVLAKEEGIKARKAALARLLALPLGKIISYSIERPDDRTLVRCLICSPLDQPATGSFTNAFNAWMPKFFWVAEHLRFAHWELYYKLTANAHPRTAPGDSFQPETWISIGDIEEGDTFRDDREVRGDRMLCSHRHHISFFTGPALIRRFIVLKEGHEHSLCIGIHTYGGRGSKDQPDPELHAVLHSTKEVPIVDPDENGMTMSPIRMKPQHPSTALPRSARIHFGRAYAISHLFPVLPLGLIHAGSMETLVSQFEENVARRSDMDLDGDIIMTDDDTQGDTIRNETNGDIIDDQVHPADISVAREIREQICHVLGADTRMRGFPEPFLEEAVVMDDSEREQLERREYSQGRHILLS